MSLDPSYPQPSNSGFSSSFKAVSRNKKPPWANRLLKDQYDLFYNINPQVNKKEVKPRADRKMMRSCSQAVSYRYTPFQPRSTSIRSRTVTNNNQRANSVKNVEVENYVQQLKLLQRQIRQVRRTSDSEKKKTSQPQEKYGVTKDTGFRQCAADGNLLGMSRFQFNQTLVGRVRARSNHHIDFGKDKTQKISNLNKVWHNEQLLIESNAGQARGPGLKKIHSFSSYKSHQLFFQSKGLEDCNGCGFGGFLDKFYETTHQNQFYQIHKNPHKPTVSYQNMGGRALNILTANDLQYQTQKHKTLASADKRRGIMELSKSERKLEFKRQVIDPKRGCFR